MGTYQTIGAFHSTKEREPELMQLVKKFSKTQKMDLVQKSCLIHFSEIRNFNNKVLFLKPEKNAFLTEINSKLHEEILPHFEKGENGYYTPENWFPHTTLATRLNQSQFSKALAIAEKIPLPLTAEISEIGFYQCSPFLELKRFSFSS